MIYFIQSGKTGPIKIGYSTDDRTMARRINALQVSHPEPLYILHTAPGTLEDEQRAHEKLARWRKRGEWFEASDEVLHVVNRTKEAGLKEALAPQINWLGLYRTNWRSEMWNRYRVRACERTGTLDQRDYENLLRRKGAVDLPPFPTEESVAEMRAAEEE